MIRKIIKLTISFISYFILCFIFVYSILLFKMNTKNSALLFSLYISFALSISFCILQHMFAIKKEYKKHKKDIENKQMQYLLDIDDTTFINNVVSFFNINEVIHADSNSIISSNEGYLFVRQLSELTKDQSLKLTRIKKANPKRSYYCLLICPCTNDIKEELNSKCIQIIPKNRILEFAASAYVENTEIQHASNTKKLSKIKNVLLEKKTMKACVKYAIIFLVLSIFTYNKLLYIIASVILSLLGIYSFILRRKHHSSTIV